jgi:hypothetical protein
MASRAANRTDEYLRSPQQWISACRMVSTGDEEGGEDEEGDAAAMGTC